MFGAKRQVTDQIRFHVDKMNGRPCLAVGKDVHDFLYWMNVETRFVPGPGATLEPGQRSRRNLSRVEGKSLEKRRQHDGKVGPGPAEVKGERA
jgi:hypothetical protein